MRGFPLYAGTQSQTRFLRNVRHLDRSYEGELRSMEQKSTGKSGEIFRHSPPLPLRGRQDFEWAAKLYRVVTFVCRRVFSGRGFLVLADSMSDVVTFVIIAPEPARLRTSLKIPFSSPAIPRPRPEGWNDNRLLSVPRDKCESQSGEDYQNFRRPFI